MPFPASPSPFRLSRRQPSTRRSAGPQFANSPRFLFSQTQQTADRDSDIADDDLPPSTAPVGWMPRPQRGVIPSRSRRDVIVDCDDEELPRSTSTQRKSNNSVYDVIDSTPPEASEEEPGSLDAGDDESSESVQDSNKRRRILEGSLSLSQKLRQAPEESSSASPDHSHNTITADPATPAPHLAPDATLETSSMQASTGGPGRLGASTPASSRTPFPAKPRFILSARKPANSQPQFRAETPASSYPTSTPAEKRKPTFVLPTSPSPKKPVDEIPAPFSPSSRSLRRRGRPRSGALGFAPGGMAAEVRSWVLDMGSKRESAIHMRSDPDRTAMVSDEFSQYILTARVAGVCQTSLSSSGPLAFIQVEHVDDLAPRGDDWGILNILAMGSPKSKPQSCSRSTPLQIQVGDLLGFYRGLAWDMDLFGPGRHRFAEHMRDVSRDPIDIERSKQRWLVAMEWDLISEAT